MNILKVGDIYENQYVVFYEENFHDWVTRLFENYGESNE